MPLIQVTSGGQRSLLKKKLQVCESQQSCLFVGDQILIFHHNLQINSLKILQCDFWISFLILSLIVEVYLWWKLQASLIFLSGRTCTIGGWLNTFLPHCIHIYIFSSKKKKKTFPVFRDIRIFQYTSKSIFSMAMTQRKDRMKQFAITDLYIRALVHREIGQARLGNMFAGNQRFNEP